MTDGQFRSVVDIDRTTRRSGPSPAESARLWFAFRPGSDTAIAAISVPAMTAIYYLNTRYGLDHPAVFFLVFVLLGNLALNTALPAYVVLSRRREGLAGLGITSDRWVASLAVSLLLAGSFWVPLQQALSTFDGDPAPHILYNAIALWEPLFVYGWLQLRFERAFGIVPAILLTGLGFAAYHVGSYPLAGLAMLLFSGILFAAIFALVCNLLVLVPITWAFASTIGTLQGGFAFGWDVVAIYAGVLAVQIIILFVIFRSTERGKASTLPRSFDKASELAASLYWGGKRPRGFQKRIMINRLDLRPARIAEKRGQMFLSGLKTRSINAVSQYSTMSTTSPPSKVKTQQ